MIHGDVSTTEVRACASRYTGKERDTESGNDYFGARYYASSMGRFLSPDPLPWIHWQNGNEKSQEKFAAYIANPQNFNLYGYVLNNPLTRTDPTGMYICDGGKEQCQAVQNSLDAVKRAADILSKGNATEQALGKKLNGILDFYGKAGDKNGVTIGFADLSKSGAAGRTDSGLFGGTKITFDNHAFNKSYEFGAAAVAHEGAHGIDHYSGLSSWFWSNQLNTETHAYQAEAAVDRGLGEASGAQPFAVWMPGFSEKMSSTFIDWDANTEAHQNCGGMCFGEPKN